MKLQIKPLLYSYRKRLRHSAFAHFMNTQLWFAQYNEKHYWTVFNNLKFVLIRIDKDYQILAAIGCK